MATEGDGYRAYSGSSSYIMVERLLKGRSRVLRVISPYITPYYAKMLVGVSKAKEVFVITTDSPASRDALNIMGRRKSVAPYIKIAAYFIVLVAILVLIRLYLMALLVTPVFAGVMALSALHYSSMRNKRVYVKVARGRFIHEKLYISDDRAIVGSPNLTYSGMHKNVEHIELITNSREVADLQRHFDSLWES